MNKQDLDYLDENIDELLTTLPVEAAPNFIENTLARLQKEKNNAFIDEKIDQFSCISLLVDISKVTGSVEIRFKNMLLSF